MFRPMFPSFATRETLFPTAKHVSASLQKHFLLPETLFLLAKLGNIVETCVRSEMFLATCFLVLPELNAWAHAYAYDTNEDTYK